MNALRDLLRRKRSAIVLTLLALAGFPLFANDGVSHVRGRQFTLDERLREFSPAVAGRLRGAFSSSGVAFPPREVSLLAFKDIRHLEVYARDAPGDAWHFIKDYRILGASGTLGPKLAAGDRQVPEGIYQVDSLNPNSRYHLSIRLNYPNAFDREIARRDGREKLGGDIMIHGARLSDGCLAMGNEAAEDLFVLAALSGEARVRVLISPTDFRDPTSRVPAIVMPWLRDLYLALRTELQQYRPQDDHR
jgi:L,D-transpeptidase catalytic domain